MTLRNCLFCLTMLVLLSVTNAHAGTYDAPAILAKNWLLQQRNVDDGSWGTTDAVKYIQTSEVVLALAAMNWRTPEYYAGIAWLENHAPVNTDFMARRILALQSNGGNIDAELKYFQAAQNYAANSVPPVSTGLGLSRVYQSSALDTALALQANTLANGQLLNVTAAVNYLLNSQLPVNDAGWAIGRENVGNTSDPATTAQVLLALIPLQGNTSSAVIKGLSALNAKVNSSSSVATRALAALANFRSNPTSSTAIAQLNYLLPSQTLGSWGGDIYATALVLRAMAAGMSFDLAAQRNPVIVPDLALRAAINQALGRSALDSLNKGELAQLTSLIISGKGVKNLIGLQYATNLTLLDARNNSIKDFTPVAGLNATILKDSNTTPTIVWNIDPGWNLVGNGSTTSFNVSTLFGNPTNVGGVWKWLNAKSTWAYYNPTMSDSGVAYAASHGYDWLTSIKSGEGFWVVSNINTQFSVQMSITGMVDTLDYQPGGPMPLPSGWNMIATGDSPTASDFNKMIGATLPPDGVIPVNLITLWAWDSFLQAWYFYAPNMEQSGTLDAYIASHGYEKFDATTLTPTTGIWINK